MSINNYSLKKMKNVLEKDFDCIDIKILKHYGYED